MGSKNFSLHLDYLDEKRGWDVDLDQRKMQHSHRVEELHLKSLSCNAIEIQYLKHRILSEKSFIFEIKDKELKMSKWDVKLLIKVPMSKN